MTRCEKCRCKNIFVGGASENFSTRKLFLYEICITRKFPDLRYINSTPKVTCLTCYARESLAVQPLAVVRQSRTGSKGVRGPTR